MTRARVFAQADEIAGRVHELAAHIVEESRGDVLLVTKLKGGLMFVADLVRHLPPDVSVDFVALTPYASVERPPGIARLVKDLDATVTGRHVIVVEDVVDTGLSVAFLLRHLAERDPASVRICTLLDREDKRIADVPVAWRGFALGDEYLVGYGLDFLGLYRNVPCLVSIDELDELRAEPHGLIPTLREWGVWRSP